MTAYGVIGTIVAIDLVVGFFGSMVGYTVNGTVEVPEGSWSWTDMFGFYWDMLTLQVDGMPVVITIVFIIMQVMMAVVIIRTIRGVS